MSRVKNVSSKILNLTNSSIRQVIINNRFDVLNNDEDSREFQNSTNGEFTPNINENRKTNPPPVFVQGVVNFKGMFEKMSKFVPKDSIIVTAFTNNVIKLKIDTAGNYRKLVAGLKIHFTF